MGLETIMEQDLRKAISRYNWKYPNRVELVRRMYEMTDDDLAQELFINIRYQSHRRCSRKYRADWLDKEWDYQDSKVRNRHVNYLFVEYKQFITFMIKDHNINNQRSLEAELKMEYYKTIEQSQEDQASFDLLLDAIRQCSKEALEQDMIRWRMGFMSAEDILNKYKFSRKTLTNKWEAFAKQIRTNMQEK